jgi:hypothetical protein
MGRVVCEVSEPDRLCRLRGRHDELHWQRLTSSINGADENRSGTEGVDSGEAAQARRMADAARTVDRDRTAESVAMDVGRVGGQGEKFRTEETEEEHTVGSLYSGMERG